MYKAMTGDKETFVTRIYPQAETAGNIKSMTINVGSRSAIYMNIADVKKPNADANASKLESSIHVYVNGEAVVVPNEVDIAIFCGMGGNLMVQLLQDCPEIVNSLKGLILQPQQGFTALRKYLYSIDWHIEDEAIAKEDGRIYQIIYAKPGKQALPTELELEIGPVLNRTRPTLFKEMIAEFIAKANRSLNGMAKSETAKNTAHYHQLQTYVKALEELL